MDRRAVTKVQKDQTRRNRLQTKCARSCSAGNPLLELQRSIGNNAVQRLIRSPFIQTKLQISTPGDQHEQEANRVADTVTRIPEPEPEEEKEEHVQAKPLTPQITRLVQREAEEPFEEEKDDNDATELMAQRAVPVAVREDDEEEKIATKPNEGPQVTPSVSANIRALQSGGSPLPPATREFFEPRFDADFSQVRVHTGAGAEETANSINAKAFTVGRNITFGAGRYEPHSQEGRQLLAHELTHVVQQGAASTRTDGVQRQHETLGDPLIQRDDVTQTAETTELQFSPDPLGATIHTQNYRGEGKEALVRRAIEMYLSRYGSYARAYREQQSAENKPDDAGSTVRELFEWYLRPDMLEDLAQVLTPAAKEPIKGQRYSFRIDNYILSYFILIEDQEPLGKTEEDPFRRETKPRGSKRRGIKPAPTAKKTTPPPTVKDPKPTPTGKDTRPVPKPPGKVIVPPPPAKTEKQETDASTKDRLLKALETAADLVTDFIPGVSNLKDAHTCIRGKNAVTGEEVGGLGRALSCIFAIPGIGNVAKYIGKGLKILGKGLIKGGKYLAKGLTAAWKWGKRKARAAVEWLGEKIAAGAGGLLNKLKDAWNWLKRKFGFGAKKVAAKQLKHVKDIFDNPAVLAGKTPNDVGHLFPSTHWDIAPQTGRSPGTKYTLKNAQGQVTGKVQVRWSSGQTGRHFRDAAGNGQSYWQIAVSNGKPPRIWVGPNGKMYSKPPTYKGGSINPADPAVEWAGSISLGPDIQNLLGF